jgi:tRNA threonylcarbamoyl adenosine modification protein YeaZ
MAITLLMDSSQHDMMIAIAKDNTIIKSFRMHAWLRQSEWMMPKIVELFNEVNLRLEHVQSVIVGQGPGSYTGTRIALTIAKILALMNKVDVRLVSSLHILADMKQSTLVVYDARADRSYVGVYQGANVIVSDTIWMNDVVMKYVHDHPALLLRGFHPKLSLPLTIEDPFPMMLELGLSKPIVSNISFIVPLYVKEIV